MASDLKGPLIDDEQHRGQKLPLHITPGTTSAFHGGERLEDAELDELGLDQNVEAMKIEFDNDRTASYCFCKSFLSFLSTVWGLPVFLLCFPCIYYNATVFAKSRLAAVTDTKLVLKWGYYGCCCVFYNVQTKSIPLDKITDLRLEQGCIQKCFGVEAIVVETASATPKSPEMRLLGLREPQDVRRRILNLRDCRGVQAAAARADGAGAHNPLLPEADTVKLEQLVSTQNATMLEIKDVLQDMRTALVSMDRKMNAPFGAESFYGGGHPRFSGINER